MAANWWSRWLPRRGVTITATDAFRAGAMRLADPVGIRAIPKRSKAATAAKLNEDEQGVTGTEFFGGSISGEEYVPELSGLQAYDTYDQMRKSADVGSTLLVVKLPIRGAKPSVNPPPHGDETDAEMARLATEMLFGGKHFNWDRALQHILLQLDFGFSILEEQWAADDDGFFYLKKWAPRLPRTIHYWHTTRDGSLVRVWQYAPVMDEKDDPVGRRVRGPMGSQAIPMPPSSHYEYIPIEADVLSVFTYQKEGDNYEGRSMLRGAYMPWYYKKTLYHLDMLRHDRLAVGVPTAELTAEANLSADEMTELKEVLGGLRANDRMYLIAPNGVRYRILGPEASGGTAVNAVTMLDHYDAMIARNMIAGFLSAGRDTYSTKGGMTRLVDFFVASLNGITAAIEDDIERGVLKKFYDYNFDMTDRQYGKVEFTGLESTDIAQLLSLTNASMPTVITPNDDLEAKFRELLGLPPMKPEESRTPEERLGSGAPPPAMGPDGQPIDPNVPPPPEDDDDDEDQPRRQPPSKKKKKMVDDEEAA